MRTALCVLVGVFVWEFASCSITCPDGNICSDSSTCCMIKSGYGCCPYPKAVCCSDQAHCCPAEFVCNLATDTCEKRNQPWMSIPMVKKVAAEAPSPPVQEENNHIPEQQRSSGIYCDAYTVCPDRTTCCRHPAGAWFCCPYYPGKCCLDGYHCCPYGLDCDLTYQHCVRQGLKYPFSPREALSSVPAALISTSEDRSSLQEETPMVRLTEANGAVREASVIRCDSEFYCSEGTTCCKSTDEWMCCPYKLGQCCADGQHCCEYGDTCDATSMACKKGFFTIPAGTQERANAY